MLMPSVQQRSLMSGKQRVIVYSLMAALWVSGCIWLYFDQRARFQDAFGGERNPWESALLTAHGILAVAGMFLFGWITAHHVTRWWNMERRRTSGGVFSGLLLLLIVSGFALFFLSEDRWQHYAALIHDILGVGIAAFAVQHWFMFRREARDGDEQGAI
jgi:hypothetical protein